MLVSREKSPKREYVVQYQESDWDFIQRWLEHEGFFYWFAHGEERREARHLGRATRTRRPSTTRHALSYRERNNLSTGRRRRRSGTSALEQKRIPARVTVLIDYNYRTPDVRSSRPRPSTRSAASAPWSSTASTSRTRTSGSQLAKLRAERILSERRTYFGAHRLLALPRRPHVRAREPLRGSNDGST